MLRRSGHWLCAAAAAAVASPSPNGRLLGTIDVWEPLGRRGKIRSDDGTVYSILHANSFETLMPTQHRELKGERVQFRGNPNLTASEIYVVDRPQEPSIKGEKEKKRAHEAVVAARAKPPPAPAPSEKLTGIVKDWSSLFRKGSISMVNARGGTDTYVIRGVKDFEAAMPQSLKSLNGAEVRFAVLPAPIEGMSPMATHIEIIAMPPDPAQEEADAAAAAAESKGPADPAEDCPPGYWPVPEGPVLGVITRWSGGQGVVQTGSQMTYYIESVDDFVMLAPGSNTLRGAVVQFSVLPGRPTYATSINVMTQGQITDTAQSLPQTISARTSSVKNRFRDGAPATGGAAGDETAPPAERKEGTMHTWSHTESQGVIVDADGTRYLIRSHEDISKYSELARKGANLKGRPVTFTPAGANGRVAKQVYVNVSGKRKKGEAGESGALTLDTEETVENLTTTEDDELDGPDFHNQENVFEEAIPDTMDTAYWTRRFEHAGFNMDRYRQESKQVRAPMDSFGMEDDEVTKTENEHPWFNCEKRNPKLPFNPDKRYSDMAKLRPVNLARTSMRAQNPEWADEQKKKAEKAVPKEVQDYCYKQAKEMAPKMGDTMRKAMESHTRSSALFSFRD